MSTIQSSQTSHEKPTTTNQLFVEYMCWNVHNVIGWYSPYQPIDYTSMNSFIFLFFVFGQLCECSSKYREKNRRLHDCHLIDCIDSRSDRLLNIRLPIFHSLSQVQFPFFFFFQNRFQFENNSRIVFK